MSAAPPTASPLDRGHPADVLKPNKNSPAPPDQHNVIGAHAHKAPGPHPALRHNAYQTPDLAAQTAAEPRALHNVGPAPPGRKIPPGWPRPTKPLPKRTERAEKTQLTRPPSKARAPASVGSQPTHPDPSSAPLYGASVKPDLVAPHRLPSPFRPPSPSYLALGPIFCMTVGAQSARMGRVTVVKPVFYRPATPPRWTRPARAPDPGPSGTIAARAGNAECHPATGDQ